MRGRINRIEKKGGIEKVKEMVRLGYTVKEIYLFFNYQNHPSLKSVLKRKYHTSLTQLSRELGRIKQDEHIRIKSGLNMDLVKRYARLGVTLKNIGAQLGYHPDYVSAKFIVENGYSITEYKKRIQNGI